MPLDRRVPRYADPPISDALEKLTDLRDRIDAQLNGLKTIEENLMPHDAYDSLNDGKRYPGATIERAQAARSIGRANDETMRQNVINPAKTQPAFTTPAARVIAAEAELQNAFSRLVEITDRTVGSSGKPESPEPIEDPIPWSGAAGEIACSAERMRCLTRRMHDLMGLLESALP